MSGIKVPMGTEMYHSQMSGNEGVGYARASYSHQMHHQRLAGDPNVATVTRSEPGAQPDQWHRIAGLAVGLGSVCAEHVLSHPCIVLRRQCQVHHNSEWYHMTPFTLLPVIFNMQRHQSSGTLWKGIGSTFITKGLCVASEAAISEFTPFPNLSFMVATPFYAASLVETTQSEIASERPGVLDCVTEGFTRLVGWQTQQTTRLFPVWKLVVPVAMLGVSHYVITSIAQYSMSNFSSEGEVDETDPGHGQPVDNKRSVFDIYFSELMGTFTGHLLADMALFPFETVLHRLMLQGTRTIIDDTDSGLGVVPIITRYEGIYDCFRSILADEGLSGLYKGFGALVLQYGMHLALLKMTRFLFERLSQEFGSGSKSRQVQIDEEDMMTYVARRGHSQAGHPTQM